MRAKPGVKCKGTRRHGGLDGHVFVELDERLDEVVWMARLQCNDCGTWRITAYEPKTWVQLRGHEYIHPKEYPEYDSEECRKEYLNSLLVVEGEGEYKNG